MLWCIENSNKLFVFCPYDKKVIRVDTWYSVAYVTYEKNREQQRFTISEVAADWHELVVPRRGMQTSNARDSEQLDTRRSTTHIPLPQSAAQGNKMTRHW